MNLREREIYRLQREIKYLERKVEKLKAMKDNNLLLDQINAFQPAYELRRLVGKDRYTILTVKYATTDILSEAKPEDILALWGWGEATLKTLTEWMTENGLKLND